MKNEISVCHLEVALLHSGTCLRGWCTFMVWIVQGSSLRSVIGWIHV